MKICSLCGSTYGDRVDFCFKDGTPLLPVQSGEASAEPAPAAGPDPTDAPHPSNLAGEDMPEPRFLGSDALSRGETVDKASRWSRPFAAPDPDDEEITASIPRSAVEAALQTEGVKEPSPRRAPLPISAGVDEVDSGLRNARTLVPERFPEMMELTSPRVLPPKPRRELAEVVSPIDEPGDVTLPRPIPRDRNHLRDMEPVVEQDHTLPRAIPADRRPVREPVEAPPEVAAAPVVEEATPAAESPAPKPIEPPFGGRPVADAVEPSPTLVAPPDAIRAALEEPVEAPVTAPAAAASIVSAPSDIVGAPLLGGIEDAPSPAIAPDDQVGGLFDDDEGDFAGFGAPPPTEGFYEEPPPKPASKLPLILIGLSLLVVGVGGVVVLTGGDDTETAVVPAEQPAADAAPDREAEAAAAKAEADRAKADREAAAEREAEAARAKAERAEADDRAKADADADAEAEREAAAKAEADRKAEQDAEAARLADDEARAAADREAEAARKAEEDARAADEARAAADRAAEDARRAEEEARAEAERKAAEETAVAEAEAEAAAEEAAAEPTNGLVNLFGITGSEVFIDGKRAGVIPFSIMLDAGGHTFLVKPPGDITGYERQFELAFAGGLPVNLPLNPQ